MKKKLAESALNVQGGIAQPANQRFVGGGSE